MQHLKLPLIALLFVLVLTTRGFAQVITTDPPFPTADAPVTITFDATQGGGGLAGYTGDVYTHTGLILEGQSAWQHVIGTWGVNSTQPQMTRIAPNIYTLEITPSIRQFYEASAQAVIQKMAFVFRASTGSPQTEDLFVDVYTAGLNISIVSPQSGAIVELDETLNVQASANEADSMFLFLNANLLSAVEGNSINYALLADTPGTQWIRILAKHDGQSATDSVSFFVRGAVPVAELPTGVINGINYINSNSVTLVLHDPPALKQYVFVIGDFNDWMAHEDYYMNRTPNGTHYWLTINNLEAGKEYIFQYYIDSDLRLADPYSHKIVDPWNDHWIPDANYPNLIEYPDNKTSGVASVLQTAQTPFTWEATDFVAPAAEDLVIYELLIRDFIATRDIKTLTDTLDYLERLGVNAIELMPINEFEGNDSWGYNPAFYFATDKAYGRKQDYKAFIDECHKRGIAVLIDMVLNHSFGLSPLVQMYFDPSAGQWGQPSAANPWYNQVCPHEPWCWGYDFDHLSLHTQEFVDRVNEYWLTEFKVDGFRFDFTKGFTNQQTGNQGSNYDAARVGILKRMADQIWNVNPNAYVILEHFADNTEEKALAEYGMLIWGNMNYTYNESTMGWLTNSNFSGISYKTRGWGVPHLIGYMESHDEERLMYKNITYGNSANPMHDVKDTTIALQRQKTAAALFFSIPGPKMIWQFGELGYDYSINHCPDGTINDNCRTSAKPIRWDYTEEGYRDGVFTTYAQLIRLKKHYDVFRSTDFSTSLSGAIKFVKLNHASMNALVIGNFDVQAGNATPQFQHTGWWYEYFSGDSLNVTDVNMSLQLQPSEYRLYTSVNVVGIDELNPAGTGSGNLTISPNPAESHVNIGFTLLENYQVVLELYSLQGKKVATVHEGELKRGGHTISYELPAHLSSGLYVVRMLKGNQVISQKFIIP
ncbi:MAG: T9SS type A sorting domain-containing protein [Bacteroidales bacterium]|nr:T9SS type A sorting domain-containing protein [Bacteroidales bacterium]